MNDLYGKSAVNKHITLMNDEDLINGCRNGDTRCQREFFKKYRESVYAVISHSLGPGFDREDIFQQAFIKLFKSLSNFKGLSSINTWVYRITSKVCIDQLRKKYRKRQLDVTRNTDLVETHEDTRNQNPEKEKEQKELTKQIYKGLDKLSVDKRFVVTMFEMEGFSLQEISNILQKPVGTIKSRLFHGRRELAEYLRPYLDRK